MGLRIRIPAGTPARVLRRGPTGEQWTSYRRVAHEVVVDNAVPDETGGYLVTLDGEDGRPVEVSVPRGACTIMTDAAGGGDDGIR